MMRPAQATKLVDPVEYFRIEYPVAFELLPDGEESLQPEITLMEALARDSGQTIAHVDKTGAVLVPAAICEFVFSRTLSKEEIADYLNTHADVEQAHPRREAA